MARGKYCMRRSTRKRLLHLCFLQSYTCHYCKGKMNADKTCPPEHHTRATLDHMTPLSRGGANNRSNLVACCRKCNRDKDNKTVAEFLNNS